VPEHNFCVERGSQRGWGSMGIPKKMGEDHRVPTPEGEVHHILRNLNQIRSREGGSQRYTLGPTVQPARMPTADCVLKKDFHKERQERFLCWGALRNQWSSEGKSETSCIKGRKRTKEAAASKGFCSRTRKKKVWSSAQKEKLSCVL